MAVTIKQTEAAPASYPSPPFGLSDAALALDAEMIWQRIEAYVAHRWTEREVTWIVEGAGDWTPPLTPATVTLAEVWEWGEWTETTLAAGPYGYCLPGDGPYRITATVGGGTIPAAVDEAFRRLAEYSAGISASDMVMGHPSYTSHSSSIGDAINESFDRQATWAARAMINSGAADLLRPYRRA